MLVAGNGANQVYSLTPRRGTLNWQFAAPDAAVATAAP